MDILIIKAKKILNTEYDKIERIMNEENYLIVKKNGKYGLYIKIMKS